MTIELQLAEAFAIAEGRPLALRPEAIDAAYLLAGKAPAIAAALVEIDAAPARRGPRRYLLTGLPRKACPNGELRAALWNGDGADDEARLAAIAESALAAAPPDLKEADELDPLHR